MAKTWRNQALKEKNKRKKEGFYRILANNYSVVEKYYINEKLLGGNLNEQIRFNRSYSC